MPSTNGHGPKRAILYARVSTDEQARSGYSLAQQIEALRQYAASEGYEVIEEVSDPGQSGASLERPGMDRVRDLVADGGVSVVLAQDADRIVRDPVYRALLDDESARFGCRWIALDDWGDDSHEGQLLKYIKGWQSKGEKLKTAERTRRGRVQKAREGGLKLGRVSKYGFCPNEARNAYEIEPETVAVVRRIFTLVAAGESLHGVKRILDSEGVPTPEGARTWSRRFIRRVILDDVYKPHTLEEFADRLSPAVAATLDPEKTYGVSWHNRTAAKVVGRERRPDGTYRNIRRFSERPREEWIPIPIPSIGLDAETVEKARSAIAGNVRPASSGARFWELSGGLARCAHCGRTMRGQNNTSGKTGKKSFYYVCPIKINETSAACENRYHRAERLEEYVSKAVGDLLRHPAELFRAIDEKIEAERSIARDPGRELAALGRQLEALAVKRSRLLDLYADGEIATKDELGEKLSRVDEDRKTVEAAMASTQGRRDNVERLETQKSVVVLVYSALAAFALEEFSSEHRRDVYERVGLRVSVHRDHLPEIELTLDPSTLPSVDSATGVLAELENTIDAEALERVYEEFLRPYRETVLDEETGEWTRVDGPPLEERETDFPSLMSTDPTWS
jgi:site-specific DNA recombinase